MVIGAPAVITDLDELPPPESWKIEASHGEDPTDPNSMALSRRGDMSVAPHRSSTLSSQSQYGSSDNTSQHKQLNLLKGSNGNITPPLPETRQIGDPHGMVLALRARIDVERQHSQQGYLQGSSGTFTDDNSTEPSGMAHTRRGDMSVAWHGSSALPSPSPHTSSDNSNQHRQQLSWKASVGRSKASLPESRQIEASHGKDPTDHNGSELARRFSSHSSTSLSGSTAVVRKRIRPEEFDSIDTTFAGGNSTGPSHI